MTAVVRVYPRELAERVRATWPVEAQPLPHALDSILDIAYHASLLRDEERPVTCRLMCVSPSELRSDAGPPASLLPLAFEATRELSEIELRSLSPAVKYHRSLIAMEETDDGPRIWGLVQSGTRWLEAVHGGRHSVPPAMPSALVINIVRPGHLSVLCGAVTLAELRGGVLTDFTLDVFISKWLADLFVTERGELAALAKHDGAAELARYVTQEMVKRAIATTRAAHHGGTIIILPPQHSESELLHLKYAFRDGPPRRRFRHLLVEIMAQATPEDADELEADLDEAVFEMSNLIAALADVDGAVVLTKRFELLGFGAEIAGDLPHVGSVRRALDLEGTSFIDEVVDGVGTRHRSAYRLCASMPDTLAIVVSQDGSVRFVTSVAGVVSYWEHGPGDL